MHFDALLPERTVPNILSSLNDKHLWETSKTPVSERYAVSKLFDHYIMLEISKLVEVVDGEPVVVVDCVTPGFCKSELLSREDGAPLILRILQWLTGRTVEEGSKTIVDAAIRGDAHGEYLEHQKFAR